MTESRPSISPAPNGPLIVEGVANMRDSNGEVECSVKMALCRCGASA